MIKTESQASAPADWVPMLILRVLTGPDWPLWRWLRLTALSDAPHAFTSAVADWGCGAERRWRVRFDDPATYNVAAFIGGRPVGMASGVPAEHAVVELRSVWVSPLARGKGVGGALIAAVETWARGRSAATLRLAVLPANTAAVVLFERHGFVAATRNGSPDEVVMHKRLC
ncbi:GNAT family N-acetyltransferase [Nocardia otitidiscaviarum]|uniref:GNAT family N-acetyltransferase n=1 Tax=Nocardia otitidiscaviarum TaxID=1823 RepID=UPI00245546DD|nr:GNAT family N-acetyltransferase [Nocardia otitidiscaviarum]